MQKLRKNSSGFSLIEVAIAIVVIGLLASFTIKGGKLIQSAKLNSINDQVTTFKIAIHLFTEKYGFLPGDLPDAGNLIKEGIESGRGDGKIISLRDSQRFWKHLIASGFLNTKLINDHPVSKIGGNFYVSNDIGGRSGTWIILSEGTSDNKNFKGIVTPEEAYLIDKNDTGEPLTGDIQIMKGIGATGECIVDSKYNFKNKNKDCVLLFKISE